MKEFDFGYLKTLTINKNLQFVIYSNFNQCAQFHWQTPVETIPKTSTL